MGADVRKLFGFVLNKRKSDTGALQAGENIYFFKSLIRKSLSTHKSTGYCHVVIGLFCLRIVVPLSITKQRVIRKAFI